MSAPYIIKGKTGDWELVIGLEVHCQIVSNAKLFSGSPVEFGSETNQNVSFVDAGMPGMLPVINAKRHVRHMDCDAWEHRDARLTLNFKRAAGGLLHLRLQLRLYIIRRDKKMGSQWPQPR